MFTGHGHSDETAGNRPHGSCANELMLAPGAVHPNEITCLYVVRSEICPLNAVWCVKWLIASNLIDPPLFASPLGGSLRVPLPLAPPPAPYLCLERGVHEEKARQVGRNERNMTAKAKNKAGIRGSGKMRNKPCTGNSFIKNLCNHL